MVGFTPLDELVSVTLFGNGTGVVGIGAAEGNPNVAIAAEGLSTSKTQVPLSLAALNAVCLEQKSGLSPVGPHGARVCIIVGLIKPVGVKIPAPEYPDDPAAILTPNRSSKPGGIPTSFGPLLSAKRFWSLTVIPLIVTGAVRAAVGTQPAQTRDCLAGAVHLLLPPPSSLFAVTFAAVEPFDRERIAYAYAVATPVLKGLIIPL
jgi:hypothetical protein